MHNCCNNYTRSQLLRIGRGRGRARACRRSSRGCRRRPGPGSRGAASSPGAPASRSPSTAPRRSRWRRSKTGSPRPPRATGSSSRSSSTAASTRSACSPRSATPATRSCGPTSPSRRKPGTAFTEDTRLRWHPAAAGAGDPPRRGQGQRLPGDRLRPPRPVALHLAPLLRDRRARDRFPHRLARPLPRPGRRPTTTRSRDSRWTAASRR